jgi:aspartate racemase
MQAIYLVKAGQHDRAHVLLKRVAATLVAQGARAMVAGCTEVPLALGAGDLEVPFVDATLALAEAAVRYALGKEEGCP